MSDRAALHEHSHDLNSDLYDSRVKFQLMPGLCSLPVGVALYAKPFQQSNAAAHLLAEVVACAARHGHYRAGQAAWSSRWLSRGSASIQVGTTRPGCHLSTTIYAATVENDQLIFHLGAES